MSINITISGTAETAAALSKLTLAALTRKPMTRSVLRLQAAMQQYPPQRAGVRYIRRGTLGRRWTFAVTETGDEIRGRVGNNTPYAPWVQSKRFQAAVHRGRWQTDEDVLTQETPAIVKDFERGVQEAVQAAGL